MSAFLDVLDPIHLVQRGRLDLIGDGPEFRDVHRAVGGKLDPHRVRDAYVAARHREDQGAPSARLIKIPPALVPVPASFSLLV